uniref:RING-type domain-containing protein n=1 Tax=viral metagenome TaxID=1070528 RepID=A0A6C0HC07_9ZZZZ
MSNQNSINHQNLDIDRVLVNNNTNRILLDFYMNLHTQTVRRIDALYDILDEVREAINMLSGIIRNNFNRNTNNTNNENINRDYRDYAGRGGRGPNRGVNVGGGGGRNNVWGGRARQNTWYNNRSTPQNQYQGLNNRVYIQGRPYRIEFERYNIPSNANTGTNTRTNADMLNFIQNFYSNVPVIATPSQVVNATRVVRFSEICNPINSSCPITLEQFTNNSNVTEILGCNHLFNPEALTSWFSTNVRCPVCRYDIRTNRLHEQEETKEELEIEETKEEPLPSTPNSSPLGRPPERNSNSRVSQSDSSDNVLESALTELTGTLLNQLFNTSQGNTANRLFFNNTTYDASANEIIFRGFRL